MNNISNYYGKFISKLTVKGVINIVGNSDVNSFRESDVLNTDLKQVYNAKTKNDASTQQTNRILKEKWNNNTINVIILRMYWACKI